MAEYNPRHAGPTLPFFHRGIKVYMETKDNNIAITPTPKFTTNKLEGKSKGKPTSLMRAILKANNP